MATYFKIISPSGHTAWQARSKITNTFKLEQSDLKPNLIRPPSSSSKVIWNQTWYDLLLASSESLLETSLDSLRVMEAATSTDLSSYTSSSEFNIFFCLIWIWNCVVLSSSIENDSDFVFRVREVDFWERPEWRDNFPDFSGFIWKRNRSSVCVQFETCGQSYKHFTLVNYDFRVVLTRKLPSLRF